MSSIYAVSGWKTKESVILPRENVEYVLNFLQHQYPKIWWVVVNYD